MGRRRVHTGRDGTPEPADHPHSGQGTENDDQLACQAQEVSAASDCGCRCRLCRQPPRGASPAHALTDCLQGQGVYPRYDGISANHTYSSGGYSYNYLGASAFISPQWGHICDTGTRDRSNVTAAFVVLQNRSATSWVQTGVVRAWGEPAWFYAEHKSAFGEYRLTYYDSSRGWAPINYGGVNRFWVQYVGPADGVNQNHWRLNVDSSIMDFTPWGIGSTGANLSDNYLLPAWTGETHYLGTDIMGTNNPTRYWGMTAQ